MAIFSPGRTTNRSPPPSWSTGTRCSPAVAFVDRVDATYPSLFEPREEVALAFRGFPANVVPSTILLDRQGRVAAVYTGAVRGDDLRTAIGPLQTEGT